MPPPSLPNAPMATRLPSNDRDTDQPLISPDASPSISAPSWVHEEVLYSYTRTWPESVPPPSFDCAPIATMLPSEDKETARPLQSPAASPSISAPSWVHEEVLYSYTRTWPESTPFTPSFKNPPIATRLPEDDRDTDQPLQSPAASP